MQITEKTGSGAAGATVIPGNLSEIATIIHQDWKNIYYGAVPYVTGTA